MARIALVTSSYLPRIGGVEEHVARVAEGLARRGHVVSVWSVDQGDQIPQDGVAASVRMLPCPLPSRSIRGLARFLWQVVPAWFLWRRAFRLDRPDVVHIHCFGPNGVYATHFAGTRQLVYSHHGETFMDSIFDRSRLLSTRLIRTLNRANAVSSCSAFSARDLERFGRSPSDVVVVPNGVDLDAPIGHLPRGLDGETPFVLGIGRLVAVKGFDTLIRAFAQIVQLGADGGVNLVIAGDGPQRRELERLTRDLGIGARVSSGTTFAFKQLLHADQPGRAAWRRSATRPGRTTPARPRSLRAATDGGSLARHAGPDDAGHDRLRRPRDRAASPPAPSPTPTGTVDRTFWLPLQRTLNDAGHVRRPAGRR